MDNLDSDLGINTLVSEPKHPDNFIYLLWFMRLKTIIGHPLYDKGLNEDAFGKATIEAAEKDKMLVKKERLPTLKLLTSGTSRQNLQWRDVGMGFPYPKMRWRQPTNPNANPETVRDWKNAVFQARYLKTFMHSTNKFTVSLSVDGSHARHTGFPFLNRKGGRARDQLRSGIPIGNFEGVAIYVRGVYVCNHNIMKELGGDYQIAAESNNFLRSIFMIINGDFDIQANRNGLTAESKKKLLKPEFIQSLRETLDHFRNKNRTNHFDGLIKKCIKQAGLAAVEMAATSWQQRVSVLKSQDRFKVKIQNYAAQFDEAHASTSRAIEAQHHTEFVFIEPSEGKENSVISIYNQLSTVLTPEYFEKANAKELQRLWPVIVETSGGEGIDCLGVSLDDKPNLSRLVQNIENVIPSGDLLNIEFKYLFRIPINEDGESKFNHPFYLTDFIICWEFSWPGGSTNRQPEAPVGGIDVEKAEGTRVYDTVGCNGQISSTMKDRCDPKMTIPASMKDFCFFITDIRDNQQNAVKWPEERTARHGVTVIALKHLIEATFNLTKDCDVKSTVEWCRAEKKKKVAPKRLRSTPGDPSGSGKTRRRLSRTTTT